MVTYQFILTIFFIFNLILLHHLQPLRSEMRARTFTLNDYEQTITVKYNLYVIQILSNTVVTVIVGFVLGLYCVHKNPMTDEVIYFILATLLYIPAYVLGYLVKRKDNLEGIGYTVVAVLPYVFSLLLFVIFYPGALS